MKLACVYFLTLTRTGVFYIGSTYDLEDRLDRHFSELSRKVHHNSILQSIWSENEEISVSSIEFVSREEAYIYEDNFIKKMRNSQFKNLMANIGNDSRGGDNLSFNPNKDKVINNKKS